MVSDLGGFHYQKEFEVMSFQISPEGKIRWAALSDLLQEVAWKHADSRDYGQQIFEKGLVWVLSRMEFKMLERPVWGERIKVKTAAGSGINPLFAVREFLVENDKGKTLLTAISAWLLLDMETKKPQRPGTVLPQESYQPMNVLPGINLKVPPIGDLIESYHFRVKPSDLDMNNHVNNVSYIRWIEDFCDLKGIKMKELLINYQAEAVLGEEIILSYFSEETKVNLLGKQGEKLVFSSCISI